MELPDTEAPTSDPFERLPEQVLHRILSLIPSCREAARTTLISRSWWRAWSSFPVFDFDFREIFPDRPPRVNFDEVLEANEKFLGFVDRTVSRLREQGIPLLRLKVWTWLLETDSARALFDKWISMALEDGVQELSIVVLHPKSHFPYSVPDRALSSDSLKTLTLQCVLFIDPPCGASTVNLNSLNSLNLRDIILIDDRRLQELLRRCPLLENLTIYQCLYLMQIKISGLSKLRMLAITGSPGTPKDVEIDLPNLEKLECSSTSARAGKIVINGCRQLKHLRIRNSDSVVSQEQLEELLSKFPLLESLTIGGCRCFKRIRIWNLLLEKIELLNCHQLMEIEIDAPKLLSLRYSSWKARVPIIRMKNIASVSSCEAEFELLFHAVDFTELRESLSRSCPFTSLSFSGAIREVYAPFMDALLASSPCDVGHLNLNIDAPRSSCAAILDGLLSICRPTTMRVSPYDHNSTFLKFLCRKLANRENDMTKCFFSSRTKCWLHKLKRVEIESITESDQRGPLDWTTLFDLLPTLNMMSDVCFRLIW